MSGDRNNQAQEKVVSTMCASHCGGACLLKAHVKDGVITRFETDDGEEPQLRGCWRGRAYRQRVYAPDRLTHPLKRVGERGEGKFERISWDEALRTVAGQIKRVRDTYGPASIMLGGSAGDIGSLHCFGVMDRLLNMAGGYTRTWGVTSFGAGIYASQVSYGSYFTSSDREDLVNSKLIILWGWDPAKTIGGTNTSWYLAQARERGAKIVSVDPQHGDTAAAFADRWIPVRPGTDTAMLIAMAYVMIQENLYDREFISTYASGFDRFKDHVTGKEDGAPKTPAWAEAITGVPSSEIVKLAREYATIRPAALMAGIAPGRSAFGEQYHRAAIALAAMTGNVGIHGGDAAGRSWESVMGGYPYRTNAMNAGVGKTDDPIEKGIPSKKGSHPGYKDTRVHCAKMADAILKGKAGGYHADYKLLYVAQNGFVNQVPDINKIVQALRKLEFIAVHEQFMTPTAKFADILLPSSTFLERNDITFGVGAPFLGAQNKVVDPMGESRSPLQIAAGIAEHLGISGYMEKSEQEYLEAAARNTGAADYNTWKEKGFHRFKQPEPHVAFKEQIDDPANKPFRTPSGKIEFFSQAWAELNDPGLPPVPMYVETWEGRNDPLAKKYPLQLITTHFKRRTLSQFENIPWLRELQDQAAVMNTRDARARGISDGDTVTVFNDRGRIKTRARVTERIMPGVVDVPHGAWYDPDKNGVDRGGSSNVLTSDAISPGGAFTYNTALVQIEKV